LANGDKFEYEPQMLAFLNALINPTLKTTGVTAGTYGSATESVRLTVNSKGLLSTITTSTITGGVSTVGTIDSLTKSSNGLVINGTTIVAQTADATNPGILSTTTQTIAGNKTFNGATTIASALNTFAGADMAKNGGASFYSETYRTGNNAGYFSYGTSPAGSNLGMTFGINGINGSTRDHNQKFRFYAGSHTDVSPFALGTVSPAVYSMDFPLYHDVSTCMFSLNSASRYYRIKTDNTSGTATERFAIQGYATNAIAYMNNISGFHIGGTSANSSALLEVTSTTKGFRLTPMTATQASAITPAEGLMLFVSNTNGTFTSIGLWCYENGAWSKK